MAYSTPYAPMAPYNGGFPVGYPAAGVYQPFYPQQGYVPPYQQPQVVQPVAAGQNVQQAQGQPDSTQNNAQNTTQQQAQMPAQDNRIYVQGESGAAAYMVPRGMSAILWDSTQPVIYIKSTDSAGRPYYLDTLDYTSRAQKQQESQKAANAGNSVNTETGNADSDKYVTKATLAELEARFTGRLEEVKGEIRAEYRPLLPLLNGDSKKTPKLRKDGDTDV